MHYLAYGLSVDGSPNVKGFLSFEQAIEHVSTCLVWIVVAVRKNTVVLCGQSVVDNEQGKKLAMVLSRLKRYYQSR